MEDSNYVTLKDASKILNVSAETLRNWDKQGKLKAHRHPVNQYRLYDLEEIQSLSNSDRVEDGAEATYRSLFDDGTSFKTAIKAMSKAFRDSMGGSLLERFEEISKLLFCKLYDEKQNNNLAFSSFSNAYPENKIYEIVNSLFQKAKDGFPNVFVNGRAELSADTKAVAQVALILQQYELSRIKADIKGKIYEELIKNTFDKNENQQFFTPRNIVEFIIQLLNPKPEQTFCDPACGSGGFLIAALEHIAKQNPEVSLEDYCREKIIGAEIDSRMVWIAQMNLILHGGHHSSIKFLKNGGSLGQTAGAKTALADNSVDIIVTNPPFGSDYDQTSDLECFELGKGKKSRRRGVLFLEKCMTMLKPGGRLAIVLEESILNNSSNEDVRRFLVKHGIIEGVFSLPDTTFMPYATVKTSILIARKKTALEEAQPGVFMCNIEQVGFAPNGDPIYSNERDSNGKLRLVSDLPEALSKWTEYSENNRSIKQDERYFITTATSKELVQRLDTLFFHPAKQNAALLLKKSKYPLFRVAELVSVINKMVVPQFEFADEMVRYIGLANIQPMEGTYYVSEVLGEKIKSAVKLFEPNTVVFAKLRPELRKIVFIPEDEEQGFVSSECFVFKANSRILPQYLALMLRSDLVYGQIIFQVTGLGRPRIGKTELLSVKIPLPPLEKQRVLVSKMNQFQSNKALLIEKSQMLRNQAEDLVREGFEEIEQELCR